MCYTLRTNTHFNSKVGTISGVEVVAAAPSRPKGTHWEQVEAQGAGIGDWERWGHCSTRAGQSPHKYSSAGMCVGERPLGVPLGPKAALKPSPRPPLPIVASLSGPPFTPAHIGPLSSALGTKEHFSSPGAPPTSATCLHRAAAAPRGAGRIQKSGTQKNPGGSGSARSPGNKVRGQNGVSFIKNKSLEFRIFFILRSVTRDSRLALPATPSK